MRAARYERIKVKYQRVFSATAAFVLGTVFCAAGISKLLNFTAFNDALPNVLPEWLDGYRISIYIPAVEMLIGINLLRFDINVFLKLLLGFLLASFLAVTFNLAFISTSHDCGCFYGQFAVIFGTSPGLAFVRAIILSIISIPIFMEKNRSNHIDLSASLPISPNS